LKEHQMMNVRQKKQDSFWKPSWGEAACIIGVILYIAVFFALQVRLYEGLHMTIADLGIFEQALYRTLHGEFFRTTVGTAFHFEHRVFFADHFHLILLLVLPFYALLPHAYTLFFLQACMAGSGALAIFLIARHKLQSEWMAICFAFSYLLYPPQQWATLNRFVYGFHTENFFPALLLFAAYFLEKRKLRLFALFFLLALTVIEYYAILLACLGLYLFLFDKRNRRIGLIAFFLSTLWYVAATQWVIPYFRGSSTPYYYEALTSLADALRNPESYLVLAISLRDYLFRLLAPLLLVPLLNLPLLATTIPNLLVNLFALTVRYYTAMSAQSHHVNPMVPVVFLSAISGLHNLLRHVGNPALKPKLERYSSFVLLCAALFFNYWLGPLPFSRLVEADQYQVNEAKTQTLREVKALIPEEGSLSAEFFIGSHFAQRKELYEFPVKVGKVDFVLIDLDQPWSQYKPLEAYPALDRLKESPNHELIYSKNNVLLFRKRSELPLQHATEANFSGQIKLLGYTLEAEDIKPGDSVQLALYWQALADMETSYTVFIHLIDQDERMMGQKDNRPVSGLYPTTEWKPGEEIVDRYEIATGPEIPPGEYSIEIGLYELESGERLPVLDVMGLPQDSRVILDKVRVIGE
jgi:uncharacterized membrane protein